MLVVFNNVCLNPDAVQFLSSEESRTEENLHYYCQLLVTFDILTKCALCPDDLYTNVRIDSLANL